MMLKIKIKFYLHERARMYIRSIIIQCGSALHKTIRRYTLNAETKAVERACKEAASSLGYQTLKDLVL